MSAQPAAKTTTNRPPSTSKERGRVLGTKIRTTIEPGKVLEVDGAELLDLHRQGLLHSFERGESTDAIGAGKSPNRWRDGTVTEVESGVITDAADDDEDGATDEPEGGKE